MEMSERGNRVNAKKPENIIKRQIYLLRGLMRVVMRLKRPGWEEEIENIRGQIDDHSKELSGPQKILTIPADFIVNRVLGHKKKKNR